MARPAALLAARVLLLLVCVAAGPRAAWAGRPTADVEAVAAAAQRAVAWIEPAVVAIQPIGARESADRLDGRGPTTGLLLGDGWVLTSSYRLSDAASLIVFFDDDRRAAAEVVSVDHSRLIALLRVAEPPDLDTPAERLRPAERIEVGQTVIAVGRVFPNRRANVALGVLSAARRLHGKAVQTDAAVSPANYGGPLIDLRGAVVGLLTPLAPPMAGAEGTAWYDSGIGFAAPWGDIRARLPRMMAGEDIHRGLLGVSLADGNTYREPPTIAKLHPAGPAAAAGLKPGDTVIGVDESATPTKTAFRFAVAGRDAGDTITVRVDRGGERLERSLTLVAELPATEDQPADGPSDSTATEDAPPTTAENAASTYP